MKDRLELLSSLVKTSLFWCAASWNLTSRQVSKVKGIQQKMLHKMIRLSQRLDEDKMSFMTRLNSKIKHLKILHNFQEWDRYYFALAFKWAGHVSRMVQYDEQRITYQVLQFKS